MSDEFSSAVSAHGRSLSQLAFLLSGDRSEAEDIVGHRERWRISSPTFDEWW
jgi:hypothetical protein